MILPLLTVLLQTAPHAPPPPATRDEKPVRVWLDPSGPPPLARGDPVRVYVHTAADGFLVVLHRSTDGHIRVLFPANPTEDPFVRGGTYQILSSGDRESFVVAEPDGQGLVLAAVSPASYRFDEFVRAADWNPDALAPSWEGADAAGGVTDIVQRMLGDGYFNYDIATYTVAPRPYAQAPSPLSAPQDEAMPPSCVGCTFVGSQVVIIESPLFGFDAPRFHRPTQPCDLSSSCANPALASAMALPSRYRVTASGGLQRRNDVFVPPRLPEASPTIGSRRRQPPPVARDLPVAPAALPVRAIPLGPGRRLAGTAPRPAAVAHDVRLTMSPITVRQEPPALSTAATAVPVNVNALRRVLVPAAAEREAGARAVRSQIAATSMSRPFVTTEAVAQGSASGGTRATADVGGRVGGPEMHAVALPMAVWRGAATHGVVVPAGARRH